MKGLEFPVSGTKVKGLDKKFDINSPSGRSKYFDAKAGADIVFLRDYMKNNTFVAYFIAKKGAGKGTYSKLFTEVFGEDKVIHVSVGDVVREVHSNWKVFKKSKAYEEVKSHYRGFVSFEDAVDSFLGRSTKTLLPTEFILALLKYYISQHEGKSIFIDGLPRDMDQVSYSLYFRDLINYRNDPDMFILIDIPEAVIDERIRSRVICPECNLSRSTKLLITSDVRYDAEDEEYYLVCDNPDCKKKGKARMVGKEGDNLGLEPIRGRLEKDEAIARKIFELHGVPKVLLRNHVPVTESDKFDSYELTPKFEFSGKEKVKVTEEPWVFEDDNGVDSHSLMAPAVVVSMIKQISEVLR